MIKTDKSDLAAFVDHLYCVIKTDQTDLAEFGHHYYCVIKADQSVVTQLDNIVGFFLEMA